MKLPGRAAAGPWTKWSGNPVIKLEGGSVTGPSEVKKVRNFYYVWLQRAATGALPTDIYRYRSSDLKTLDCLASHNRFSAIRDR